MLRCFNHPCICNVTGAVAQVFVEYESVSQAAAAQAALAGRTFNGRVIVTGFISDEDFHAGKL